MLNQFLVVWGEKNWEGAGNVTKDGKAL